MKMTPPFKKLFFFLLGPLLLFSVVSCGAVMGGSQDSYEKAARRAGPTFEESTGSLSVKRSSVPEVQQDYYGDNQKGEALPVPQEPQKRKKIYSGFLHLLVPVEEEARSAVSRLADQAGGYVVSSREGIVEIRVPSEAFFSLMDQLEELGDPEDRRVETADVTEAYQDVSRRLEIYEKTRQRLYILLEKSEDVEERLEILREIRRLTEDMEALKNLLQEIDQRLAFSRITVKLEPRVAEGSQTKTGIPFPLITQLDPLYPSTGEVPSKISWNPGKEFALFEKEEDSPLRAEAADGTRLRLGSAPNDPRGDGEFWQKALIHHLQDFYQESRAESFGSWRGGLFTSKDEEPFFYAIALVPRGDKLLVAEAFFPHAAALAEHLPAWKESLKDAYGDKGGEE